MPGRIHGRTSRRAANKTDQLSEQNELKFTYNSNGTIKTSTEADGNTTKYEYDEHGNLKEIKPPAPLSPITIKVNADSQPEVITDGAGHKKTITYNKLEQPTKIVYSGTGTEKTVKYEFEADGNIVKREDSTGTTTYTVDPLNRITREELVTGGARNSYEYDSASNLTAFTDSGGTTNYKYNGLDELASMKEPEATKETTFAYNNDQELTSITYPSGVKESYKREEATGRPETITAEGITGGPSVPKLTYTYKSGSDPTSLIHSVTESTSGAETVYKYDPLDRLTEAVTKDAGEQRYQFKPHARRQPLAPDALRPTLLRPNHRKLDPTRPSGSRSWIPIRRR
jgi:YD repeat-containing protein